MLVKNGTFVLTKGVNDSIMRRYGIVNLSNLVRCHEVSMSRLDEHKLQRTSIPCRDHFLLRLALLYFSSQLQRYPKDDALSWHRNHP